MNTNTLAACALSFALGACNYPPSTTEPSATAPATVTLAPVIQQTDPQICPSQDFKTFLTAFADDIQVQKTHINDPLESESVDAHAKLEPKLVTHRLHANALRFPLMPNMQQQAHDGLTSTLTSIGAREMQVKLTKEDTDYQMTFTFKNEGCWTLYRMEDDSL